MGALPFDLAGDGGDVVLLLHGAFGSRKSWLTVTQPLVQAGLQVAAADLPGHGRRAPRGAATLDAAVDDVVATARALRAGRLVVVGHSLGGSCWRPVDDGQQLPGPVSCRCAAQVAGRRTPGAVAGLMPTSGSP